MAVLWFATIALLGIDSLFAMLESVTTNIEDMPRFSGAKRQVVALWVATVGFLASLVYVSDIGVFMADLVDHTAVNLSLMAVGTLQAYTIAWVWGWTEICNRTGSRCASARLCFSNESLLMMNTGLGSATARASGAPRPICASVMMNTGLTSATTLG